MKTASPWPFGPRAGPRSARDFPWLVLAGALASALFFALPWQWLDHWEADSVDFRLRLRGVRTAPSPVVLVGVDDSSFTIAERAPAEAARIPALARMGAAWPWDRRVLAETVDRLTAAGARAVVFDFVLAAETPGDEALARALAASPVPVALARQYVVSTTLEGERTVSIIGPREIFRTAGPRVRTGFANIWPDDDGVVRLAHTTVSPDELLGDAAVGAGGSGEPSLAALAALDLGRPPPAAAGLVDFPGPAGTIPLVPIEHLFLPDRWAGPLLDQGRFFRDKVVLVGPVSEVRFKDYYATPFGRMAGAELQAGVIASLLGDGLLRELTPGTERLLVLLLALLAAGTCLTGTNARWHITGLALLLAAWLALAQGALTGAGWVLPVAAPIGALLATGVIGIGGRYAGEQRERRRMRTLLASYVSESVAKVILRQPEGLALALGGARRPVTVLFSDLRDFTRLTETAPPAELVAQLNEYLHAMVDCVLAEGGTVQKFIGDALLAVWGDTHTAGEAADATRAVAAALAMESALERLNAGWAGRADRVQLQMGLGLHQGVVTVGNLGHPKRMEFGVLGDAVNTASRLEGATKYLGIPLLAGEPVARLAGREKFARIGRLRVAGRVEPVEIHTPLDPAMPDAAGWTARYAAAEADLRAGRHAAALAGFRRMETPARRLRALVDFQINRATELAALPAAEPDAPLRLSGK